MNELTNFDFEGAQIRALTIDEAPYFVGKDVATVLGYAKPTDATRKHVDPEDRGISKMETPGGTQEIVIINESGLYSLILGSKMPDAKRFKRWVTSEVLPAIRKHGAYATDSTIDKILGDPDFGIRLLQELKTERENRKRLEAANAEMQPKALFADAVAASHTSILIGDLAKIIKQNGVDMGQRRLFAWMRDNVYLIRRRGADWNSPTQKAIDFISNIASKYEDDK